MPLFQIDYWLRIVPLKNVGESAPKWDQRTLVEALAQINALTAEDERKLLEKQKGRCGICGRRLGKKYHLDHIRHLALGGSPYKSNLQIVHPACNDRKHAKDPFVFARTKA